MTSPPTGRQPWEPGCVHTTTAFPLMEKSDGGDHMCRPDPCAREKHDAVHVVILLHLGEGRARLLFGGDHDRVVLQHDAACAKGLLRTGNDGLIDEGSAHGVLQAVLVYPVDDETDRGLDHARVSSGGNDRGIPSPAQGPTTRT